MKGHPTNFIASGQQSIFLRSHTCWQECAGYMSKKMAQIRPIPFPELSENDRILIVLDSSKGGSFFHQGILDRLSSRDVELYWWDHMIFPLYFVIYHRTRAKIMTIQYIEALRSISSLRNIIFIALYTVRLYGHQHHKLTLDKSYRQLPMDNVCLSWRRPRYRLEWLIWIFGGSLNDSCTRWVDHIVKHLDII